MTFKELFESYVKSPGFRKLSTRSKQMYMYVGERMSEYFGDRIVKNIRRPDLLTFQNESADKPAYSNLALRVASVIFAYALDMDMIDHNPAARIKKLKGGSHVKWTPEEVKEVVALRDRKISTAVAIAWYTGQREGDILSMRWKDFDGEYISVIQQKTNLDMKIKAHPDLIQYLNGLRGTDPDDYYIVSGKDKMGSSAFRNMLKRRTDKLNISKVFHGIRKGVASNLAEKGRPISEIAAILGHKTMRMAAYYSEQASTKTLTENAVSAMESCV